MTDQDQTQFDDMVSAWTNYQRQLWDCWGSVAKSSSPGAPLEEAYKRPLGASEELSKNCLQIVSDCAQTSLNAFNPGDDAPPMVSRCFEQMQYTADRWFDTQQQTLDAWFKAIKMLNSYTYSAVPISGWTENANRLFETWNEATEKTLETQESLLAFAMPLQAKEESKTEAEPSKKKRMPAKESAAA